MSDSMNIRDQVREGVNEALDRHGDPTEDLSWDVGYTMEQTPMGPAISSFFVITMRSLIFGSPPLAAPLIMDPRALRDPTTANQIVIQILAALRDSRRKQMSLTNGGQ